MNNVLMETVNAGMSQKVIHNVYEKLGFLRRHSH